MVNEILDKSSRVTTGSAGRRDFPKYGFVGLGIMIVFEILLFTRDWFWIGQWFTPIMWTGYVMFMNALVHRRKGTSLLSDHPFEFFLLAAISIGSWTIFEGYNVLLGNWRYVELPENMLVRYIGYAWAFATISPGMFVTYELLNTLIPGRDPHPYPRLGNGVLALFVITGLVCVVSPLIWHSPWLTPFVWMGFAFLLDPLNGRMGERSFLTEFFTGRFRSMPIMFLAGLICGLLWEFWNYWAASKWHYQVPYLGHIKLFEMPVLGYLGFMPFAVESYALYVLARRLIPIKREVRYLG